jgi:aminopeptidase Y
MRSRLGRSALAAAAVTALVGVSLVTVEAAAAPAPGCATRTNNNTAKLLECVTLEGVREHQAAFQEIADDNNGTRVSGSPGYDESVDYVEDRLLAAGWNVTRQALQFQTFVNLAPPVLERVAPPPTGALESNV